MRRALIGIMSAGLLLTAGCSQPPGGSTPAPGATKSVAVSTSPAATATATATATPTASASPSGTATPGGKNAEQSKKLQDESGIQFTASDVFAQEVKPDGELQLESKDEFIAINTSDTVDAGFEGTLTMLKKIGGDTFKQEGDAKEEEQEGVKAKLGMGTLEIKGQKMTWMCMVATAGKKPLRIVAMGKDLEKSDNMNKFMQSVKKQ